MHNKLLRIVAVCSSLLLMGGFVYVRAGGTLFPVAQPAAERPTTASQPTLMPGPKSASVEMILGVHPATSSSESQSSAVVPQSSPPPVIMSGSKSLSPIVSPSQVAPTPSTALPKDPSSGSKYIKSA